MFVAAIVTALLLFVPGAVIAVAAGLRPMPALAAAGPIIIGVTGYAAWVAGLLDVRWGWFPALVAWAGAAALAYLARRFVPFANTRADSPDSAGLALPDRRSRKTLPGDRPVWAPTPGELAVGAVAAATSVIASVRYLLPLNDLPDGGSNLREAWDLHWHYNFLRFAAEEGVVSPTRTGELMNRETQSEMFYPAAWHSLASLLPGDVFLQGNVFGAVAPVLLLPAGAALLAWVVAGRRWGLVAAATAALTSILLPEITAALMITGSLPYLFAVAAIPATMALLATGRTIAAVPALAGAVLVHPAAGVALALFTLFWWLTRPRLWPLARLAATAVLVGLVLLPVLFSVSGQGEVVSSYHGQQGLDRGESLLWTITGMSNYTRQFGWYPIPVALSLVGAAVLLFRRRPWTPWPVFAIVFLGIVSDSAQARWADPFGDWLRAVGTFFYDMAYRVQAPMGVLRLVLIGVAVAWLAELLAGAVGKLRRRKRGDRPAPHTPRQARAATALVTAAAATVAMVPAAWASADEAERSMLASRGEEFLTPADRRAMDWLARQPRVMEGHVLVNPAEGSGMMYALHGLPSLFSHFPWPDSKPEASRVALDQIDLAGTGVPGDPRAVNDVDGALRKLGVRYVFVSPPSAGAAGGAALASRSWAWWSAGLTPVYQDGSATIFAVKAAFTDEELRRVVADSPHPPAEPDVAKTPFRQPIIAPAGEMVSPLAGATVAVRATGDDPRVERPLAEAVARELRARGATVVESVAGAGSGTGLGADGADDSDGSGQGADWSLPDGLGMGADGTGLAADGSTSAATTATVADGTDGAYGTAGADAVIDIDLADGGVKGFRITGRYPGATGESSPRTANLAGGIRDALVLRGYWPGNTFDGPGGSAWPLRDGLEPRFGDAAASGAPEVVVAPASASDSEALAELGTDGGRLRFAQAVADGIAAMLRQR